MSNKPTYADVSKLYNQIDSEVRKFLRQIGRQYTQTQTQSAQWTNLFQLFVPFKIQDPIKRFCISPTHRWLLRFWQGTQSACDDLDDFNELYVTGWQADVWINVEPRDTIVFFVTFENMSRYEYTSPLFDSFEALKEAFPSLLPHLKFADK